MRGSTVKICGRCRLKDHGLRGFGGFTDESDPRKSVQSMSSAIYSNSITYFTFHSWIPADQPACIVTSSLNAVVVTGLNKVRLYRSLSLP